MGAVWLAVFLASDLAGVEILDAPMEITAIVARANKNIFAFIRSDFMY